MKYTLKDVDDFLWHHPSPLDSEPVPIETARQVCEDLLATKHDDFEIRLCVARIDYEQNDLHSSKQRLTDLAAEYPQDWRPHFHLGQALFRSGEFALASASFESAIETQSQDGQTKMTGRTAEILSELTRTYVFGGATGEAIRFYRLVIDFAKYQAEQKITDAEKPPSAIPDKPEIAPLPLVYIPVEIKARELKAKLLLAVEIVRQGFSVVLTQSWTLLQCDFTELPRGIILFKTLNQIDAGYAVKARVSGHLTAVFDEEAFGRASNESVCRLNTDSTAVSAMNLIMCQGRAHATLLKTLFPYREDAVCITGSPRSELLRKIEIQRNRAPAGDIKEETSGFILICLMFGNINPTRRSFSTTARTTLELGGVSLASEIGTMLIDTFGKGVELELNLIQPMIELISSLSHRFPDHRVVVRPHPSEDKAPWDSLFRETPNVLVNNEGPLSDWLRDAALVIYLPGCGSGVEARLAGVPALCFVGDQDEKYPHVGLSSEINAKACTIEHVVQWVEDVLANRYEAMADDDLPLADHLFETDAQSAVSLMAKKLKELYMRYGDQGALTAQKESVIPDFRFPPFPAREFHRRKFPETTVDEIETALEDVAPGFAAKEKKIKEIGDNAFLIQG